MFHVEYDRGTNCVNIKVEGFWKPEDVAGLAREVNVQAKAARAIRPDFDTCVESPKFPVQAADVADLLAHVMRAGMTMTTGRTAVVVRGPLNKLQAERTLVHPRVRVFLTVDEARAWLAGPLSG